ATNLHEASIWLQKAAQQGDAMAQITVLQMAAANKGNALPRPEEMAALYLNAAAQGYPEAQTALGHIYADGLGVARDPIEARKWYAQAADRGEADALHWIGASYLNGDTAPRTVGEGIEASAKAFEAFSKAAGAGYPPAEFNLGMMRLTGEAGDANPQEAFALIQKAAEQNLPAAQTQLASMYEVGQGTTRDFAQAYQWYVRAAALGDQEAARSVDRVARHLPHESNTP
ncbi:MAG: tetratricopeptide repeat protein, partial [Verrucomicrobia bacterium]|nr:tetratricopeptide repeat protein [Verrucomicrobiota bacterium]